MKTKVMTIALLTLMSMAATAQTLDHAYSDYMQMHKVDQNEHVYATYSSTGGSFYVYGANHALLKAVALPANASAGSLLSVTKKAFNSDALMEIMYTNNQKVIVINENGTVLFERDSFATGWLYSTSAGTKLILMRSAAPRATEVYSLPGVLPTGMSKPNDAEPEYAAYPNPAVTEINLGYVLPEGQPSGQLQVLNANGQVVDTVPVGPHFNSVKYNVSQLPKGVYFYGLNGQRTQRFIVQ